MSFYLSARFVIRTIVHICEPPANLMGLGFLGVGLLVLIFFYMYSEMTVYPVATHQSLFYFIVADFCFPELLNSTPLVNTSVGRIEEPYK